MPGSGYFCDHHGIVFSTAPLDPAVQTVPPKSLRPHIRYLENHPKLEGHPDERRTYETMRRESTRDTWAATFTWQFKTAATAPDIEPPQKNSPPKTAPCQRATVLRSLCTFLQGGHFMDTTYKPQPNGQAEPCKKTTDSYLRGYVANHQHDRDLFLEPLLYAYNCKVNHTSGTTSFRLPATRLEHIRHMNGTANWRQIRKATEIAPRLTLIPSIQNEAQHQKANESRSAGLQAAPRRPSVSTDAFSAGQCVFNHSPLPTFSAKQNDLGSILQNTSMHSWTLFCHLNDSAYHN